MWSVCGIDALLRDDNDAKGGGLCGHNAHEGLGGDLKMVLAHLGLPRQGGGVRAKHTQVAILGRGIRWRKRGPCKNFLAFRHHRVVAVRPISAKVERAHILPPDDLVFCIIRGRVLLVRTGQNQITRCSERHPGTESYVGKDDANRRDQAKWQHPVGFGTHDRDGVQRKKAAPRLAVPVRRASRSAQRRLRGQSEAQGEYDNEGCAPHAMLRLSSGCGSVL